MGERTEHRKRLGEDAFRARIKARSALAKARKRSGVKRVAPGETPKERRAYVESRITSASDNISGHRYVHDDAWGIPLPHKGGREFVFAALVGTISDASILIPRCSDSDCVNPAHCEIELRTIHAEKLAGTFDPLIIGPDGRTIKKSEFEKSLRLYTWRVRKADQLPSKG